MISRRDQKQGYIVEEEADAKDDEIKEIIKYQVWDKDNNSTGDESRLVKIFQIMLQGQEWCKDVVNLGSIYPSMSKCQESWTKFQGMRIRQHHQEYESNGWWGR